MNLMYQLLFYLELALSSSLTQPGGERATGNITLTNQERIRPADIIRHIIYPDTSLV